VVGPPLPDAIASALVADVDDLVEELRTPDGEPAGALVLFHGRGTSEQDLAPLLDVFDPRGRLVGAFPRGPLQLPPIGYHWYLVERVGYPDPETFLATFERLQSWLAGLAERTGVPIERTVLGGFSQGAVMAWAMGLGPGRPRPAGILAMSGFIPTVPGFELQLDGLDGLPVAITHGSQDPVIPADLGRDARDRARAAGADVVYRETEVPHIVDPRVVPGLVEWLEKRF
jgi:phospholipase/carboxylesterase